ncbi:MAG: hypothetical protein K1X89_30595, partial [Myxococcaceae bacterium]|nr:hypothetical protein [Myxococcaceae bacterium]
MKRALVAGLLFGAACSRPGTLVVEVDTSAAKATRCLAVVVRDPASLAEVSSGPIAKDGTVKVLVARGRFPADVVVYAMGYSDDACTTSTVPPERTENQDVSFKAGKQQVVKLTLVPRPNAVDLDHDGYFTPESGGDDCDDGDPQVHPGSVESCANGKDDDCDTQRDCAQPSCGGQACGPKALAACSQGQCLEQQCNDGQDNDGDGKRDCADSDCDGAACPGGGTCAKGVCGGASTEAGLCDDGADNDGDGKSDCADSDCLNGGCDLGKCVIGGRCSASGQCQGGTAVDCSTPPSVCQGAGSCDPLTGTCRFPAQPGKGCDDGDRCTGPDQCTDAGVCAGGPRACVSPNTCLRASACEADAGCRFTVDSTATCDDGDPCTSADGCLADAGCGGKRLDCTPPSDCLSAGSCGADGGCQFSLLAQGTACSQDAGVCNAAGRCVPTFPYRPSQFVETQLPTPPPGLVSLDCTGTAVVDTKGAGAQPTFTDWCAGKPLPGIGALTLSGGQEALLLTFDSVSFGGDFTVRFVGPRPVVIAALGNLEVLGTLRAESGGGDCVASGAGGSGTGKQSAGGGGFGTAGAPGNGGPPAGVVNGTPALVPLRGGCPGGSVDKGGVGGQGGGALQLSAAGNLTVGGFIAAPGGPGEGGPSGPHGAGAGGSGGGLVLDGLLVIVAAPERVTANGGSGGQGGGTVFGGNDGNEGPLDGGAAPGGSGSVGGKGGNGGARGTLRQPGNDAPT